MEACKLDYLPLYSPFLSSLEEAFSKTKRILRQIGTGTIETLVETVDKALDVVSTNDARGLFGHCGYRTLA